MTMISRVQLAHVVCLLAATVCESAMAANPTPAQSVQITSIMGYSAKSGGDVLLTVSATTSGCEAGFWLPATSVGFASIFTIAKSALGTKAPMVVVGDRDQLFAATSDHYCLLMVFKPGP